MRTGSPAFPGAQALEEHGPRLVILGLVEMPAHPTHVSPRWDAPPSPCPAPSAGLGVQRCVSRAQAPSRANRLGPEEQASPGVLLGGLSF